MKDKKERFVSLDVFRGAIVIFMIVVNSQPMEDFFEFMSHGGLNERFTFKDLVFPFFLIIMGFAIGLVDSRKILNPMESREVNVVDLLPCVCNFWVKIFPNWKIQLRNRQYYRIKKWSRVIYRTIMLFLLGLGYSSMYELFNLGGWPGPKSNLDEYPVGSFDFFDVLQKISITYLPSIIIVSLVKSTTVQIVIILFCQLVYYVFLFWVSFPCMQGSVGVIEDECSANLYFDEFFGHEHTFPMGVLSTLNTISLVYFGVLLFKVMAKMKTFGKGIRVEFISKEKTSDNKEKDVTKYFIVSGWFFVSSCLLIVGVVLDRLTYPATQIVWSHSFIYICCGSAGIILSVLFFIIDVLKINFWIQPFVWCGVNPLFLFVGSQYLFLLLRAISIDGEDNHDLIYYLAKLLNGLIQNKKLTNVIFGICFGLVFLPFVYYLYKKKIYLKL